MVAHLLAIKQHMLFGVKKQLSDKSEKVAFS